MKLLGDGTPLKEVGHWEVNSEGYVKLASCAYHVLTAYLNQLAT